MSKLLGQAPDALVRAYCRPVGGAGAEEEEAEEEEEEGDRLRLDAFVSLHTMCCNGHRFSKLAAPTTELSESPQTPENRERERERARERARERERERESEGERESERERHTHMHTHVRACTHIIPLRDHIIP